MKPGRAQAEWRHFDRLARQSFVLSNSVLTYSVDLQSGLRDVEIRNLLTEETMTRSHVFELKLAPDTPLFAEDFKLADDPKVVTVKPDRASPRLAAHLGGKAIEARLTDASGQIEADWKAILLDGSNYVREELTLKSLKGDADIHHVILVDAQMPSATVRGSVSGSPAATDSVFCGLEHPMANTTAEDGRVTSWMNRKLPLKANTPVTYSAVYGVSSAGQLRRGFLNYVERERAHPYRPFLHYNSWYDIGYFNVYNEKECLDSIDAFGEELVKKRGVKLSSYLFDDGWDDRDTVWKFHSGFPHQFTPLKEEAAKYGAAPGVWLSPWGGYGDPRKKRLAAGAKEGMEIDQEGYALSGPKYFDLFRKDCLEFVNKYGINQFKFDGTGSPDKQFPGSAFDSDFDAAIQLIHDLREAKPDLFINLTTGTWPSPFWLRYADSTWRGGEDHSFAGVGPKREQWITYRDGDTYHGVVQQGKLYPVTSLMLHGLIYAHYAGGLKDDPGNDFANEVHDYFGNGTQLQEMYITHSLLTKQNWDDIAESAKWSQANQDVLVDSHWVGGDPTKLEVYGWASWSPRKGILVLRNPSDKEQTIDLDVAGSFELPTGFNRTMSGHSPWKSDKDWPSFVFEPGRITPITLLPFQVLVLDVATV